MAGGRAEPIVDNAAIARVFAEIGDLLEIKNANPFKIRAYRNAADTIAHHGDPIAALAPGERLGIPGIGKDLAAKITERVESELKMLRAFNDPNGIYARMPLSLNPR